MRTKIEESTYHSSQILANFKKRFLKFGNEKQKRLSRKTRGLS